MGNKFSMNVFQIIVNLQNACFYKIMFRAYFLIFGRNIFGKINRSSLGIADS